MALLAAEQEVVRTVAEEGAIVEEVAGVVAPGGVVDGADRELRDVADGQVVEIGGGPGR